jgi:hypothetical protein
MLPRVRHVCLSVTVLEDPGARKGSSCEWSGLQVGVASSSGLLERLSRVPVLWAVTSRRVSDIRS